MKLKIQKVFNIIYSSKNIDRGEFLVEADSMQEAISILEEYKKDIEPITITGIHTFKPVLKPISKTISHTINVEL